jgi:hypothetical protein
MAHHDDVGPHRVERRGGIDQRLALLHGRGRHRHVHHVGPEPFAGELERGLRARRWLEEQVDLRAPAQDRLLLLHLPADLDGLVRPVEQRADIERRQAFDAEEMAVREGGGKTGSVHGARRKTPHQKSKAKRSVAAL